MKEPVPGIVPFFTISALNAESRCLASRQRASRFKEVLSILSETAAGFNTEKQFSFPARFFKRKGAAQRRLLSVNPLSKSQGSAFTARGHASRRPLRGGSCSRKAGGIGRAWGIIRPLGSGGVQFFLQGGEHLRRQAVPAFPVIGAGPENDPLQSRAAIRRRGDSFLTKF